MAVLIHILSVFRAVSCPKRKKPDHVLQFFEI
jgi:hypothetical protein